MASWKICEVLIFVVALTGVNAGKLSFSSIPEGYEFELQDNAIEKDDIHNILLFLFGLPAHKTKSWNGMKQMNIFHPPKANLFIEVLMPAGLTMNLHESVVEYETENGELRNPPSAYINQAFSEVYHDSLHLDYNFDDKDFYLETHADLGLPYAMNTDQMRKALLNPESIYFTLLSLMQHLNVSNEADMKFIGELQVMQDVFAKRHDTVKTLPQLPKSDRDFFHPWLSKHDLSKYQRESFSFELSSLVQLVEAYGADSEQVKEAVALLEYYITTYTRAMKRLFNGELLASVLEVEMEDHPSGKSRNARSLLQTSTSTTAAYVAPNIPEFAIVFNLSLWIVIVFALAVIASSYALWFMDPGQDSIIYRMTSQRMKME